MKRNVTLSVSMCTLAAAAVALAAAMTATPLRPPRPPEIVAGLLMAAREASDRGDPAAALAHLESLLARYPREPQAGQARLGIGCLLARSRRWPEAKAALEAVIARHPRTEFAAEARCRLGYLALAQADREGARAAFRRALEEHPRSPHAAEAGTRLGFLLLGDREREPDPRQKARLRREAAEQFRRVFSEHPQAEQAAAEAHAQYAGIVFEWALDGELPWDEVRDVCREVLTLYPASPVTTAATAQLMLAETYYKEQDYARARDEAQRVFTDYPEARTQAAYARWVAGQALHSMHRFSEAIDLYRSVLEGDYGPGDNFKQRDVQLMCTMNIAHCLRALGQTAEAAAWYEHVARDWPGTKPAARALDAIDAIATNRQGGAM